MRVKDSAKEITILKTALKMIESEGLAGLRMSDLARRAGVATGTLYIYHPSKEAIVQSLYSFVFGQISLDILRNIDQECDLKCSLRQVALNYLREFVAYPEYWIFVEQYLRSPYAQEEHKNLLTIYEYLEPVIELFRSGIETGVLKQVEPSLLLTIARGALDNYGWRLVSTNSTTFSMDEFNIVFEILWDAVAARPK
jgi:TetR/AcrR family transcriptional regulator, multidrug resistance operon repressor